MKELYKSIAIFYKMCNAPATFQFLMNDIFKDMIDEEWVIIYINNIFILFKDKKFHQEWVVWVLGADVYPLMHHIAGDDCNCNASDLWRTNFLLVWCLKVIN